MSEHKHHRRTKTYVIDQGAGKSGCNISEDTTPTLNTAHGGEPAVLDAKTIFGEDVAGTLVSSMSTPVGNTQDRNVIVTETYQKTTGASLASGYDKLGVQEAMNDMYVVQPKADGCNWDGSQVSPTLTANNANGAQRMPDKDNFNAVVQSLEVYHCTAEEESAHTLKARDYKDPQCVAYGLDRASYNQGANAKWDFKVEEEEGAPTLISRGPGAVCTPDSTPDSYQDTTETLDCCISKGTSNQIATNDLLVANRTSIVRRLTPLECERLQAFPDNWTNLPNGWTDSNGKFHKPSDSNRYKALGNSIALCWWEWMAARMMEVFNAESDEEATLGSLFDGIGGFPLVYSRHGCRPVWASEIEEFPIAVTKLHFPEEE